MTFSGTWPLAVAMMRLKSRRYRFIVYWLTGGRYLRVTVLPNIPNPGPVASLTVTVSEVLATIVTSWCLVDVVNLSVNRPGVLILISRIK